MAELGHQRRVGHQCPVQIIGIVFADKIFGRSEEILIIIETHEVVALPADISAGPGDIEQLPGAVDPNGIPGMVGSESLARTR